MAETLMPPETTETTETTENDEVVELIRSRSDVGFRRLIEDVGPKVKGLLMRKFGSDRQNSIEDAIVQAAETLWLRGQPYDPNRGSLVSWLYAPAARICVTAFRAEQARPLIASIAGDSLAEMFGAEDSALLRSETTAILLEDLRDCIAALTPREQEIIYASLSGFDGTDVDLGARLGTSDNVVRVTRSRAHRKLAQLMRRRHGNL